MSEFDKWYENYWGIMPDEENPQTYQHQKAIWNHQQEQINALKKQLAEANNELSCIAEYLKSCGYNYEEHHEPERQIFESIIEYQQKWSDKK